MILTSILPALDAALSIVRDPGWQFLSVIGFCGGIIKPLFSSASSTDKRILSSTHNQTTSRGSGGLIISLSFFHLLLFVAVLILMQYTNKSISSVPIIAIVYVLALFMIILAYRYHHAFIGISISFIVIVFLVLGSTLFKPLINEASILFQPQIEHVTPVPPAEQAHSIIQRFYDNINKRDYHAAYSLLGNIFQRSQPYNTFAQGYVHTEHDDISFQSIKLLPKGYIEVLIIIKATEQVALDKNIATYQATYIIGKENNTYKMLEGSSEEIKT